MYTLKWQQTNEIKIKPQCQNIFEVWLGQICPVNFREFIAVL
jgi:hypothetical protein